MHPSHRGVALPLADLVGLQLVRETTELLPAWTGYEMLLESAKRLNDIVHCAPSVS